MVEKPSHHRGEKALLAYHLGRRRHLLIATMSQCMTTLVSTSSRIETSADHRGCQRSIGDGASGIPTGPNNLVYTLHWRLGG